ncbi:MAG: hypothetical protein E4H02_04170 [Lentisphaerales bacterium]|nr:MAG: hypothetical protein E4H02_04170 [Lentisphaerales bacterium]
MNDYLFFETDHFTVSQVSGYRVPGYVIVQSKVDCTRLADFSPGQAADLVKCLADAESLEEEASLQEILRTLAFK